MSLPSKMKAFWTRDRAVLMTCIGIALCFWFLNRLSSSFRQTKSIRLDYELPKGKAFSIPPPLYVQVTMQGTGWDMLLGSNQSIPLALNTDAVQIFPLKNLIIQNLGNELVSSNVEQIIIQLEDAVTGTFPIEVVTNITFAKGFDLAQDIELTPSVVTVVGPKSVLENLENIKTDTLRALNLSEKSVQKLKLMTNPILQYSITEVEAKLQAEQFTEKSMFIPIVVKNAPQKLKIFPNKIKLDCTVALSRYAELNANNFVAEVDLRFSANKGNTLPIILSKQSSFARNIKFSPKSAEFYIEK
jgi:hypothetical protein